MRLWIMLRDQIDYEEFCRRRQKQTPQKKLLPRPTSLEIADLPGSDEVCAQISPTLLWLCKPTLLNDNVGLYLSFRVANHNETLPIWSNIVKRFFKRK
jgi:hypothetical protein